MGIRYYDAAIAEKLRYWINDPQIQILAPDETDRLFRIKADENRDTPITLPFIALSRKSTVEMEIPTKRGLSSSGMIIATDGTNKVQLNAIPITLEYQLDIYTRHFAEGDEYLRNFIFNLINDPKFTIKLPYNNLNILIDGNIRLSNIVEDTSDIPQRLAAGQFTRWTLNLIVDDAKLFSVPITKVPRIDCKALDIEIK